MENLINTTSVKWSGLTTVTSHIDRNVFTVFVEIIIMLIQTNIYIDSLFSKLKLRPSFFSLLNTKLNKWSTLTIAED